MDNFKSYCIQFIVIATLTLILFFVATIYFVDDMKDQIFFSCIVSLLLSVIYSIPEPKGENRFKAIVLNLLLRGFEGTMSWLGIVFLFGGQKKDLDIKVIRLTIAFIAISSLISLLWTEGRGHKKNE